MLPDGASFYFVEISENMISCLYWNILTLHSQTRKGLRFIALVNVNMS